MGVARLITIPLSHYCEKARWGLEHAGVPFEEDGHMPMLHNWATRWAGAGRTVPALVHDGRVLGDSTLILEHADALAPPARRLYPSDPALRAEVQALEELFDTRLGPAVRRIAYFHLMPEKDKLLRVMSRGVGVREAALFRGAYPVIVPLMPRFSRFAVRQSLRGRAPWWRHL